MYLIKLISYKVMVNLVTAGKLKFSKINFSSGSNSEAIHRRMLKLTSTDTVSKPSFVQIGEGKDFFVC